MRFPLVLAALALAIGGCVSAPAPAAPGPGAGLLHWAEAALASAHDHADPALHANLSTPNFEILGYDPLISEDYGTTVHGNLCGDAASTTDGRRLAVVETRGDVAFSVVDVTDASNPQRLGELIMRRTYVYDLTVAPDGKHVVLVTSQTKNEDNEGTTLAPRPSLAADAAPMTWRSACAPGGEVPVLGAHLLAGPEDPAPRPSAALLVSIEDPAQPRIVDHKPLPVYGHGVSIVDMDGRQVVLAAALACTPLPVAVPIETPVPVGGCSSHAQSFHFYEITDASTLEPLSVYTLPASEDVLIVGHNDGWIAKHPVTQQWIAYLAAWDHGLMLVDVTDPTSPTLVGQWTDYRAGDAPDDSGNIHSAAPLRETWDGRHYTVIGPEIIGHPTTLPTGVIRVLDTTDPAAPFDVAAWTLPHDVVWEDRLHWSTHYLSVHGRTAFVSMYHGGVWALDLSDVGTSPFTLLPAVGAFLPLNVSPSPPERPFRWAPTLEEVHAFDDGTLVTFDTNSGLYTFRFDATRPMEPPAPWAVEPVAK